MMKNYQSIILLLFGLMAISLHTYGQGDPNAIVPPKLKTHFGLKVGANLANITNSQTSVNFSPDMKTDFLAGVLLNFHYGYRNEGSPLGTGYWGFQPEILYSRQGFVFEDNAFSFDYITVPILCKVYITRNLSLEAGPYMGYLIGVSPGSSVIDGAQIKMSDIKGGLDAGAIAGVSYELSLGFMLDVRYNYGMSEVAKNLAWKNNVLAFSIGWLF